MILDLLVFYKDTSKKKLIMQYQNHASMLFFNSNLNFFNHFLKMFLHPFQRRHGAWKVENKLFTHSKGKGGWRWEKWFAHVHKESVWRKDQKKFHPFEKRGRLNANTINYCPLIPREMELEEKHKIVHPFEKREVRRNKTKIHPFCKAKREVGEKKRKKFVQSLQRKKG